ncbi:hypothetical protein BOTBODRAFT_175275 [Botryobasidium botryosum FD-172 SS1]|uniref:F-box domain-containing protein n=1 Tax=Botryobasidium botryosum (strain FD-172 SS1) TaxID=930990 RepID=A0A067MEB4_BOTB1|nr:hypothetical protein BOTBODRAFT_175275 [Botryobasidium botryosum FD-172 SS1]
MILKMTEKSATNSFHPLDTRAPLNLVQVSKLWREIALNTSSLWVVIDVRNIGLARTFLEWSRSAALEITMVSGEFYDKEEDGSNSGEEPERLASELKGVKKAYDLHGQNPYDFLKPLFSHISRWKSLTLEASTDTHSGGFLLPLAPALTTLYAIGLDTLHPDLFNKSLPNLSRLRLVGIAIPPGLAPTALKGLRWLTLEDFEYEAEEMAQFLDLLQAHPLLESLTLQSNFICDFLMRIVVPPSLRVEMTIHYRQLPTIAPSLNTLYSCVSSHPIRSWSFKLSGYRLILSRTTANGTKLMQLGISGQLISDMSDCFNHVLPEFTSESLSFSHIVTGPHRFSLTQPSTLYTVASMSFVHCDSGLLNTLFTHCPFPRLRNLKVENCHVSRKQLSALVLPAGGQLEPAHLGLNGHMQIVDACRVKYFEDAVGVPEVFMVRRFDQD